MTAHISVSGFAEDAAGFVSVICGCGVVVGPMPDPETALDAAMEHAYQAAMKEWADASD